MRILTVDDRTTVELQGEVDAGRQPWRLEPELVARATLEGEGVDISRASFRASDLPPESGTGKRRSVVRANVSDRSYDVELIQPGRQGPTGLWMATALRPIS